MKRVLMALSLGLCSALSYAQFADEFVGQFTPLAPSAKANQWSIKLVNHGYEVTSPKAQEAAYLATNDEQMELWHKLAWDQTLATQATCLITQTQAMLCHAPQNPTTKSEYFVVDDTLKLTPLSRVTTQ
jgi:hypothetical protein